ncbi:hypothetical protein [Helicobacter sp. MIT 01-3238]|uniref:hypothetical protein n=1 Tax=Helicobacter sp. MIT 01-3238 TaxID=398627 RepID=UPI000E1E933A|nr:hypothetical protein [Helicobacter sp. MIT 01-3238]RDU54270.1 hypothetical protein CQA40_03540 [Helicobacter sp. MIT 01-3238]
MESIATHLYFWVFLRFFAFGVGVFALSCWLHTKSILLTKTLLFISLILVFNEYDSVGYDNAYKGIVSIHLILLGLSFLYIGLIKNIRIYSSKDTPFLKQTLLKHKLFDSLGFVAICIHALIFLLFPAGDDYAYSILFCMGVASVVLIWGTNKLNQIYKEIRQKVDSLGNKNYFTLPQIYQELDIQGDRYKFKAFIDEITQGILSNGEIASINLYSTDFYFKPQDLQDIIDALESIPKETPKLSFKEATKQAQKIIDLDTKYLEDFLKAGGNVNKYIFDDGAYFIHNINLDNFAICSSCGKAEDKNSANDIEGEWFCSALCEDTENRCIEISEDLNPAILEGESYESFKERFSKNLSNTTSTAATTLGVSEVWAKNFQTLQNADTGHGFAAEIMNNENDIWAGRDAQIIGGDNALNGADRLVDGIKIQTKYLKTAPRSVGAGFDNKGDGNYKYIDKDTGKPMVLEVPKDQYDKAVKVMEEKIRQGKVQGVTDPNEAKSLVKKGSITYQEAKDYSKFCSKESLKFDARNGAVVAVAAFGVSFVINTSLCYYRGRDIKQALKESIIIGIRTGGKAFAIYMVGAQMQRIPALNQFLQQVINFNFNGNAVGRALAEVGKKGASSAGKGAVNSAANSALRGTIVVAAATMAVTSSVEVVQMMRGQISGMQCVKNIAVNAGGIAGGAAGALAGAAALSFIPGVGTIAGGLIGGIVGGMGGGAAAKKIMDKFIEDDLAKKQRIFFEHIITLSVLFKLSKDEGSEFLAIVNKILQDDADFFGKKFSVKAMLPYANSILKPIVVAIVSQRPKLPNYAFNRDIVIDVIAEEIEEAS